MGTDGWVSRWALKPELMGILNATAIVVPSNADTAILAFANTLSEEGYAVYVCDGVGDDEEIQEAVDFVEATGYGGKITMLPGDYLGAEVAFTPSLISSALVLEAYGAIYAYSGTDHAFTIGSNIVATDVDDAARVQIEGLKIKLNANAAGGVKVYHATSQILRDLDIYGTDSGTANSAAGITVQCGESGYWSERVRIQHCTMERVEVGVHFYYETVAASGPRGAFRDFLIQDVKVRNLKNNGYGLKSDYQLHGGSIDGYTVQIVNNNDDEGDACTAFYFGGSGNNLGTKGSNFNRLLIEAVNDPPNMTVFNLAGGFMDVWGYHLLEPATEPYTEFDGSGHVFIHTDNNEDGAGGLNHINDETSIDVGDNGSYGSATNIAPDSKYFSSCPRIYLDVDIDEGSSETITVKIVSRWTGQSDKTLEIPYAADAAAELTVAQYIDIWRANSTCWRLQVSAKSDQNPAVGTAKISLLL